MKLELIEVFYDAEERMMNREGLKVTYLWSSSFQ